MPANDERPLLVTGVTLFDGTGAPPLEDGALLVIGDRIAALGPREEVPVPTNADVHFLHGHTVLPGLIDTHAHARTAAEQKGLLATGITTALNPGGPSSAVAAPDTPNTSAPDLLCTGLPLDAPPGPKAEAVLVTSEHEIRQAVEHQVRAGAAGIKLYTHLPPNLVAAAVAEAHALGVFVLGDLAKTSWIEAARAGVDILCHLTPQHPDLLPQAAQASYLDRLAAGQAHPLLDYYALLDPESPELCHLVGTLREHRVMVQPTLVTLEAYVFGLDQPAPSSLQTGRPASRPTRQTSSAAMPGWPPVTLKEAKRVWPKVLDLVRFLHEQGVCFIAGSDAPRPGVPLGLSLHRELSLLNQAGLGLAGAIAAATSRAAAALGLADRGQLAPGRIADLLVVAGNPLHTLCQSHAVRAVVRHGVWHVPSHTPPRLGAAG